ncbi:hypothetical protein FM076_10200 [Streptomyces albus subsp. chlorinus]|uniref:hypothetical protein n=1 Tax=Streptomyces albus TaxID=1888 RepID=UPI00156F60C0|nr:hypothetical protein [Streptomyces albus]NSC21555.1 hypothetical protein [Streptomyces albus subsp. chlorinus]
MQSYDIEAGPGGIKAPDAVESGAVTFQVRATGPGGAWLGLAKTADSIPLEKHLDNLRRAYGRGPEAREASWVVDRDFVMLGGAAITEETSVTFSVELAKGTYHFIDYKRIKEDGNAAALTIRAEPRPGAGSPALPEAAADIVQKHTADGPRFLLPDRLRSGAPVRITNRTDQYNEAVLMAVKEGATDADVDAFFTAVTEGRRPPVPDLIRSEPVGSVPLSHGRSAVVSAPLTPGPYVLATWITNHRTGRLFAAEGMHKVVTVV